MRCKVIALAFKPINDAVKLSDNPLGFRWDNTGKVPGFVFIGKCLDLFLSVSKAHARLIKVAADDLLRALIMADDVGELLADHPHRRALRALLRADLLKNVHTQPSFGPSGSGIQWVTVQGKPTHSHLSAFA